MAMAYIVVMTTAIACTVAMTTAIACHDLHYGMVSRSLLSRVQGLWLAVGSVREDAPAGRAGLAPKDLVTRSRKILAIQYCLGH